MLLFPEESRRTRSCGWQSAAFFSFLLTPVLLAVPPIAASAADPVLPFNGQDLAGWVSKSDQGVGGWRVGSSRIHPEQPTRFAVQPGGQELINDVTRHGEGFDLYSQALHGDARVFVEVKVPQGSNSGIYLMGEYEVQVLDSHGRDANPGAGDMGAIYGAAPPRQPKYLRPGEWNTYEIHWRAPRFDAEGQRTAKACFLKVILNGVTIHENVEMGGVTPGGIDGQEKPKGPLMFQGDHGPVAYRNIRWEPLSN